MEVLKYCGELKSKDVSKPPETTGSRDLDIVKNPATSPWQVSSVLSLSLSPHMCEEYIICLKTSFVFLIHKMRNMVARMPGFPSYHPGTQKRGTSVFFNLHVSLPREEFGWTQVISYPRWNSLLRQCLSRLGEKSDTKQTVQWLPIRCDSILKQQK